MAVQIMDLLSIFSEGQTYQLIVRNKFLLEPVPENLSPSHHASLQHMSINPIENTPSLPDLHLMQQLGLSESQLDMLKDKPEILESFIHKS